MPTTIFILLIILLAGCGQKGTPKAQNCQVCKQYEAEETKDQSAKGTEQ